MILGSFPSWAEMNNEYPIIIFGLDNRKATILPFDVSHNFLAQVIGRRYIRLFPPSNASYLYP